MMGDEIGRNEDDPDVYFMYDPEVFIQRSTVKGNLYGTLHTNIVNLHYTTYIVRLLP